MSYYGQLKRSRAKPPSMWPEEIRYWLKVLHEDHGWSWELLGRVTGLGDGKHVASKVRGNSWVKLGEQLRVPPVLDRIISGELVPTLTKNSRGKWRQDAMYASSPRPLDVKHRMRFDLKSGRLMWVPKRKALGKALPDFATVVGEICQE